ncbi:MAG: response regulator [Myxococcaceae bacterium]|nr:response regulator [Myxococcaceae bacterium]
MSDKPLRRVLLVDDEEHVTRALERALRKEGYEISSVNDPREALALLKTQAFDIVISDHLMPGMNGIDFTKLVRDRYPDMLRIMLTGQPDTDMVIQAINHGEVYRFVKKPWNDLDLKCTLSFAFEHLDTVREQRRTSAVVRRWNSIF